MARQDSLICVARTETRDIQGLASFGLLAWRYIHFLRNGYIVDIWSYILHLGFGDVDLDICHLLVGVPAYYIVRTGAQEGVVLCTWHIVHAQMGFISY